MFELCRNSLLLLEIIYHLLNYNLLNVRMKKLQGYFKVNFKACPTRMNYAETAAKGSLFLTLIP